jgi:dihydroorotase-like cyclic amidohydrolase
MLGRNAATGGLDTVNDMPVSILMLMSTSVQVGGRTLMLGRNAATGGLTTVNDMPVSILMLILTSI